MVHLYEVSKLTIHHNVFIYIFIHALLVLNSVQLYKVLPENHQTKLYHIISKLYNRTKNVNLEILAAF